MTNCTKKAFTLAEATLTLFLLSVIAGVMIPAALNVSPDQFKTGLRNAYNMTASTVNSLINNENLYPSEKLISDDIRIPKGFLYDDIGTKHTYNNSNEITEEDLSTTDNVAWEYEAITRNCSCTAGTKLVRAFCCSMDITDNRATSKPVCTTTSCKFTTNNGMYWTVTQNSTITTDNRDTTPILYVEVDLNGTGKPNSKTASSPDQYKFNVFYNGRITITQGSSDAYYQSSLKAKTYLENPMKNKKKE